MGFDARNASTNEVLYAEETTVPSLALTLLQTFTNIDSKGLFFVDEIIATGQVDAEYRIYKDGDLKIKYRTSEQDRTMRIKFPSSWKIQKNGFIDIKVYHSDDNLSDFSSTIIGHRVQ